MTTVRPELLYPLDSRRVFSEGGSNVTGACNMQISNSKLCELSKC